MSKKRTYQSVDVEKVQVARLLSAIASGVSSNSGRVGRGGASAHATAWSHVTSVAERRARMARG